MEPSYSFMRLYHREHRRLHASLPMRSFRAFIKASLAFMFTEDAILRLVTQRCVCMESLGMRPKRWKGCQGLMLLDGWSLETASFQPDLFKAWTNKSFSLSLSQTKDAIEKEKNNAGGSAPVKYWEIRNCQELSWENSTFVPFPWYWENDGQNPKVDVRWRQSGF